MQYTVVHSKDPYLLARLATDLQIEGFKDDIQWNETYNPFTEHLTLDFYYMALGEDGKKVFHFYSHNCPDPDVKYRHELTSRNYIKVLTQILEP